MFKSFRPLTVALAAGLCFSGLIASTAQAGNVDQALQNLLGGQAAWTSTTPGYYQSEARGVFVAGGGDVRFPSRTYPSLVSLTLPGFHAGCGGISVYFGGFSFISGDQIKQMIQSVAQDSVGMAIDLAMTTLCAPCAHVMQVMRALAKDAAATSINSCQAARALMQRTGLTKLLGPDPDHKDNAQVACSSVGSKNGSFSDYLSGMGSCVDDAGNWLDGFLQKEMQTVGLSNSSPAGQQFVCNGGGACNTMWTLLSQTPLQGSDDEGIRDKLILMNVVGTNIYCGKDCSAQQQAAGSASGSVNFQDDAAYYPPMLGNVGATQGTSMDDVFTLFMCGTNWNNDPTQTEEVALIVKNFCDGGNQVQMSQFANLPVWDCAGSNPYAQCLTLKQVTLGGSKMAGYTGYLPYVANILEAGVNAVRTGNPMPQAVINLIQLMPVPVYEAIDVSAVYPDAGNEMMATMAVYCAQLLVDAHLRTIVEGAAHLNQNLKYSQAQLEQFYAFLGGMRATIGEQSKQMAQDVVMEEQLMQQIRQLNVAMQKDVVSQDLLGPSSYATALVVGAQNSTSGAQ